ncbi:MAG: hypothetical protein HOP08_06835 [Cyclobacteriaceae bacterium]|nr:hypothetical protein [Cyclobacteriaceae bacterium]
MRRIIQFAFIGLFAGLFNCSTDAFVCIKDVAQARLDAVPKTQLATDIQRIDNYLTANNIVAIQDPTGLRYQIISQGTGQSPCVNSKIAVAYSGRVLLNTGVLAGTTFDSSTGATFTLSGLILGWQIAFPKLPNGTTAKLYVPSGLAYGSVAQGTSIPANSVLVFDVELLAFQN